MPKFHITIAQSVRAYGSVEIEAASAEAAIELLRADAEAGGETFWQDCTDLQWDTAQEEAVVSCEGPGPDGDDVTLYDGIELTPPDAPWQTISAETLKDDLQTLVKNGNAWGDTLREPA